MHSPVDDNLDDALHGAAAALRGAERLCVLTGAGVSAESGVNTFRGAGGLWEGHRVEDVATPEAFARDPELVWKFYNARRSALRAIRPNPGHDALAALERRWGAGRFTLATQNVDGLHHAAGSQAVLELHGSLRRVRCTGCRRLDNRELDPLPDMPKCGECGALLRPDVVWFHEMLPEAVWRAAAAALAECDCLLVVGTSAVVYPAAGLIDAAMDAGKVVIEVNPDPAAAGDVIRLRGPSGVILPQLVQLLG
jgi:NAD-dependent deacetylase